MHFTFANDCLLFDFRMLHTGTLPDDESYNLVIGLLILMNQVDSALKYLDLTLKSGYMLSLSVFSDCVRSCVNAGRLDTLSSIIEKCKVSTKFVYFVKSLIDEMFQNLLSSSITPDF